MMNLLDSDDSHANTLREACSHGSPFQIRQLFTQILLFGEVSDPFNLYFIFKQDMMEDFLRANQNETLAEQNSLIDIQHHLMARNKSLKHFDLPEITTSNSPPHHSYDVAEETTLANNIEPTLNAEQRTAIDGIFNAITNHDPSIPNIFFIDGPVVNRTSSTT